MTADRSSSVVPKRRFPEFRDAGDWMTKILDNQGAFRSSLTGKTAKDFDTGDAAFIPYMNVFSNTFSDISDLRSVNVGSYESQNAVAKGDVFFTISSEIPEEAGMSSVLLEEIANCYLNSFCALFRFDDGKSPNPVFLGYLLRSALARAHLSRGAQGATRYNISKATFRSLPLQLPSGPEQQKIADCLGSLDDLIAAEGRKLEALRQHKQGLMQQLFPRPGETVPRLRFPEFRADTTWLAPQLADLYNFKRTNTLSRDNLNYEFGTIRNIHYGDIHTKFKALFKLENEHVPYANLDVTPDGFDNDAFCEEGDIVFADASEDLDGVGKAIEVVSLNGERVVAGTHTILATRRGSVPVVGFGGQLFQSAAVRAGIKREAQGAKVYGISANRISVIPVPVPPTEAEQQRIATCLSSLEDVLAAQARTIDALKQQKQGLLQQLFPRLETK